MNVFLRNDISGQEMGITEHFIFREYYSL